MQTIVIVKSKRTLTFQGVTCKIGLGKHPEGAKREEGDGKTPEGDYFICTKNAKSKFYLSMGISYPNETDALIDQILPVAAIRKPHHIRCFNDDMRDNAPPSCMGKRDHVSYFIIKKYGHTVRMGGT